MFQALEKLREAGTQLLKTLVLTGRILPEFPGLAQQGLNSYLLSLAVTLEKLSPWATRLVGF